MGGSFKYIDVTNACTRATWIQLHEGLSKQLILDRQSRLWMLTDVKWKEANYLKNEYKNEHKQLIYLALRQSHNIQMFHSKFWNHHNLNMHIASSQHNTTVHSLFHSICFHGHEAKSYKSGNDIRLSHIIHQFVWSMQHAYQPASHYLLQSLTGRFLAEREAERWSRWVEGEMMEVQRTG